MSNEYPPETNPEETLENIRAKSEKVVPSEEQSAETPSTESEDEEVKKEKIEEVKNALNQKYDQLQMRVADEGKQQYHGTAGTTEKQHNTSWWKKIALPLFGLVGAMAVPQTSEGKSAEDTLIKKNTIEAPATKKAAERDPLDLKQYEKFGIRKAVLLETSDTTKYVLLVSIPEYKSYGDVFTILKKAGLTPASTTTMDEAVLKNEEIFREWKFVISLKETVNKRGKTSYSTVSWDDLSKSFIGESREVTLPQKGEGVIPTSAFDSNYDRYTFIVEVPVSKTAAYK